MRRRRRICGGCTGSTTPTGAAGSRCPVTSCSAEDLTGVKAPIVVLLGAQFPDDRRPQGAGRLCLSGAAAGHRPVRSRARPRGVALDRQLLPRRRCDLAHSRLPRRRGAAGGHEPGALRLAVAMGDRSGRHHPHVRARKATSRKSTTSAPNLRRVPENVILNQFSEFSNYLIHYLCTGKAFARVFKQFQGHQPSTRLAAFVAATGSAGTIAAGDYLKELHGTKIVAVEAVECPTMLMNGYGEHNIQGIGDKHIPLIHNVMNTDVVIGVSDAATDALNQAVRQQCRPRLSRRPPQDRSGCRQCLRGHRHFRALQHPRRDQARQASRLRPQRRSDDGRDRQRRAVSQRAPRPISPVAIPTASMRFPPARSSAAISTASSTITSWNSTMSSASASSISATTPGSSSRASRLRTSTAAASQSFLAEARRHASPPGTA